MPSIIEVDTIKNKTGTQNTVLSTDGSGNNTLNANTIKDGSATKTLAEYSSSAWSWGSGVPTGSCLQLKSTTKTDVTSTSGLSVDTLADITGMSVVMTPKTTTSKFFVTFNVFVGVNTGDTITFQLKRDTTDIAKGDDGGGYQCTAESIRFTGDQKYSMYNVSHSFLDDPTLSDLSNITYKLQWVNLYSTTTVYLNRSYDRLAAADRGDCVSTISVMEIAG